MKVYIDGDFYDEGEAKVSVFDHGLLYGDGVFEGIRFYNDGVFRLSQHIDRLYDSASSILLKIGMSREEMCAAVIATIRENELHDGYVRLVVTRGSGGLGLNPYLCEKCSVIIIAANIQLYAAEKYEKGLILATCSTRRPSPAALSPQVKSLNYLNNVMAKVEAINASADEGLMLNDAGLVAECTGDNVFVVKNGQVSTPPVSEGQLDGITRREVMAIAGDLGIPLVEAAMTRYDIYTCDECFLTGTAAEVIPAVQLDGRVLGDGLPGPITQRLISRFREIVAAEGDPIYADS